MSEDAAGRRFILAWSFEVSTSWRATEIEVRRTKASLYIFFLTSLIMEVQKYIVSTSALQKKRELLALL